jgi:hypothetical protein
MNVTRLTAEDHLGGDGTCARAPARAALTRPRQVTSMWTPRRQDG